MLKTVKEEKGVVLSFSLLYSGVSCNRDKEITRLNKGYMMVVDFTMVQAFFTETYSHAGQKVRHNLWQFKGHVQFFMMGILL